MGPTCAWYACKYVIAMRQIAIWMCFYAHCLPCTFALQFMGFQMKGKPLELALHPIDGRARLQKKRAGPAACPFS